MTTCLYLEWYQRKANGAETVKGVIDLPDGFNMHMELFDISSGGPVTRSSSWREEQFLQNCSNKDMKWRESIPDKTLQLCMLTKFDYRRI
jgi:hypothetical protein